MYIQHKFTLTKSQATKIDRALKNGDGVSLRLGKHNIHHSGIPLLLTKSEASLLEDGKNHIIKISHSRLKEHEKVGGFLPLLAMLIPAALSAAASIAGIVRNSKAAAAGKGLYVNPMGKGVRKRKGKGNCNGILPNGLLGKYHEIYS